MSDNTHPQLAGPAALPYLNRFLDPTSSVDQHHYQLTYSTTSTSNCSTTGTVFFLNTGTVFF